MLDEGVWAEIKVGNEHLRLFSERNAQGIQASVYNVAVGGDWPGSPDATSTYPQTMLVDYVRVYSANHN